jgi:hypothetical protein
MSLELLLRLLERVHGHLGVLAALALLHPVILLRSPRRRARLAVVLAVVLVSLASGLGAGIYPSYRHLVKPHLFREHETIGWFFERKEHLAVAGTAFAWLGALLHLSLPWLPAARRDLAAIVSHRAFVIACAAVWSVAAIGVAVATVRSF